MREGVKYRTVRINQDRFTDQRISDFALKIFDIFEASIESRFNSITQWQKIISQFRKFDKKLPKHLVIRHKLNGPINHKPPFQIKIGAQKTGDSKKIRNQQSTVDRFCTDGYLASSEVSIQMLALETYPYSLLGDGLKFCTTINIQFNCAFQLEVFFKKMVPFEQLELLETLNLHWLDTNTKIFPRFDFTDEQIAMLQGCKNLKKLTTKTFRNAPPDQYQNFVHFSNQIRKIYEIEQELNEQYSCIKDTQNSSPFFNDSRLRSPNIIYKDPVKDQMPFGQANQIQEEELQSPLQKAQIQENQIKQILEHPIPKVISEPVTPKTVQIGEELIQNEQQDTLSYCSSNNPCQKDTEALLTSNKDLDGAPIIPLPDPPQAPPKSIKMRPISPLLSTSEHVKDLALNLLQKAEDQQSSVQSSSFTNNNENNYQKDDNNLQNTLMIDLVSDNAQQEQDLEPPVQKEILDVEMSFDVDNLNENSEVFVQKRLKKNILAAPQAISISPRSSKSVELKQTTIQSSFLVVQDKLKLSAPEFEHRKDDQEKENVDMNVMIVEKDSFGQDNEVYQEQIEMPVVDQKSSQNQNQNEIMQKDTNIEFVGKIQDIENSQIYSQITQFTQKNNENMQTDIDENVQFYNMVKAHLQRKATQIGQDKLTIQTLEEKHSNLTMTKIEMQNQIEELSKKCQQLEYKERDCIKRKELLMQRNQQQKGHIEKSYLLIKSFHNTFT